MLKKKTEEISEPNLVEPRAKDEIKNEEVIISNIVIPKVEEKVKVDESLEKYKKGELNNVQEIDGDYLIESFVIESKLTGNMETSSCRKIFDISLLSKRNL